MPKFTFAEVGGLLYATDGFGRVLRWNGRSTQMVNAGIDAPTTAPTLTFSGRGTIAGTYEAYVRFLDSEGRMSDLGPVSDSVEASSDTGTITSASNATPIVITTDVAHGLTTGDFVEISGVGGNESANGGWLVTVLSATTFSLDGSSGDGTYTGSGTWISGVDTLTYTNVPVSTDPKVTIRQILRNTSGQADVYYVDVETADLNSTTFVSTRDDEELSTQESQAIFDSEGNDLAQVHLPPPQTKIALAYHQDRLWLGGEEDYTAGSCKVTLGATTVVGVGTDWKECLVGRNLHVDGSREVYAIEGVNEADQELTLATAWSEASDNFATYAIRSTSYEAKLVLFSEPGLPESVPLRNALPIRQNSDRIRGVFSSGSYLYVVEERHIHRIAFGADPLDDSGIFPASERGCLNQRCWSLVEDKAYMLDEQGIHVFDPNEDKPISQPIQDVFRPESRSPWRINWRARDHFHSVLFEQQDTVRWFVALAGCARPLHGLCYNFRLERWWIEAYPRPISASCVGRLNGIPTVFLGSDARTVAAYWQGTQDFLDSSGVGTKRGTATAATITTLTDSTAAFDASVVGTHLNIVDGRGRGQARRITGQSATQLTVQFPWLVLPDATSVYQIGGVSWQWRSKRFRLPESDTMLQTGLGILFEPTEQPCSMDVQVFKDFSRSAASWATSVTSAAGNQLRTDANLTQFTVDMQKTLGFVSKKFDRKKSLGLDGPRYLSVNLSGVTNGDKVSIYEMPMPGLT